MAQFVPILRLRRNLAKNRLIRFSSKKRTAAMLLTLSAAAGLLLAGHLAAPTLMEPPLDLATPRGLAPVDLPPGAAALEAAFWLTALLASVLNFRVLELLFRRRDVVALQTLPIEPSALFMDRFIATIIEALVTSAAAAIFFLPLLWHDGMAAAAASIAMLFGGLLLGAVISLMVMILSTRTLVPDDQEGPKRSSMGDAYGGAGQILLYAPALALGAIVVSALFWKLLVGEPMRLGYFNEPFWIGTTILAVGALVSLIMAYRAFVAHYYAMAPRFHEADAAEFSAVIDYQESSFQQSRRWEWGLGPRASIAYRALEIDDDRRIAGGRVGYAVVIVLAIIGLAVLELSALPFWAIAMIPAILIAAVVNPWHRLFSRVKLLDDPLALPLSRRHRQVAATRAAIREFFFVAGPYAVAVVVILGYFRDLHVDALIIAGLVLLSGPAIAGGISLARRLQAPPSSLRWMPTALLIGLSASAIVSLFMAIAICMAIVVLSLLTSRLSDRRHAPA